MKPADFAQPLPRKNPPGQLSLIATAHYLWRVLVQMDLFAKDHPLEAAALRRQSAKPKLRNFMFEELPTTVRHRIYKELLLKPKETDDVSQPDDDSYTTEHEKVSELIENLMILIGEGDNQMHPEIMRTNKKIHEEAATVLYGENWFTWETDGMQYRPMWRWSQSGELLCPRRYSRLITKMRLIISTRGDYHDPSQADAIYWTTINVNNICKELTLNDFKILKVDFYNALGRRHGGSARKGYYGERCLEPLKKCGAEKVGMKPRPVTFVFGLILISIAVPHQ